MVTMYKIVVSQEAIDPGLVFLKDWLDKIITIYFYLWINGTINRQFKENIHIYYKIAWHATINRLANNYF